MNVDASGPELDRLADAIAESSRVAVLCGAGISAASGVPTFRGKDGLWRQHRAEELATPEAFAADPQLVWDWYGWRRRLILPLAPNPAHHALDCPGEQMSQIKAEQKDQQTCDQAWQVIHEALPPILQYI